MRENLIELACCLVTALLILGMIVAIQHFSIKKQEPIETGVFVDEVVIKGHPIEADPPILVAQGAYIASDTPVEDAVDDQFEELVQIVMAEGGNTEPDMGLRLICDSILNRVDDSRFPNSIHDVIYQRGQFQPVGDGVLYRFEPTEKVIQICAEEIQHRTNNKVLFFRTQQYHSGTNPIAHIGHHYYSGK